MRMWVSFSDAEFDQIQAKAKEAGMTPQKYVSFCALSRAGVPTVEIRLEEIYSEIHAYLAHREKGETFICSDVVPAWWQMSRSDKMCVSKYVSEITKKHPEKYEVIKDGSDGHAKVYKVR